MKHLIPFLALLLVSCESRNRQMSIDDIRFRLEGNRCRAVLDKASYEIMSWEYTNDQWISNSEMLQAAMPESLLKCPATLEWYLLEMSSGARVLTCPSGHGSVVLMED